MLRNFSVFPIREILLCHLVTNQQACTTDSVTSNRCKRLHNVFGTAVLHVMRTGLRVQYIGPVGLLCRLGEARILGPPAFCAYQERLVYWVHRPSVHTRRGQYIGSNRHLCIPGKASILVPSAFCAYRGRPIYWVRRPSVNTRRGQYIGPVDLLCIAGEASILGPSAFFACQKRPVYWVRRPSVHTGRGQFIGSIGLLCIPGNNKNIFC